MRSAMPPGWHQGAFMQIFVRAYQDGNGDGIGDLPGLISRLDYLQDLGVQGLWLMPIHPSQDGDHGYAVTDYRAIHPDYGTLDDFDTLLRQAHARGIGVIIDYVVNHSAAQHPLFQRSRRRGDPHRDWYLWQDRHPKDWRIYDADPWRRDGDASYFAAFSRHMPDFNWRHGPVVQWHHDNLRFWLDRGVDGFRFDAVGHLVENGPDAWDCQPENYGLMRDIRRLLDTYEHRYMVCEVPGDPAGFARVAGSAFAFDINADLVAAAGGSATALGRLAAWLSSAPPGMATLLSNHDHFAGRRAADQLHGHTARLKLAASLNLLLPGTPFVYYGEEIGMRGHRGLPADAGLRTPMSWTGEPVTGGFTEGRPFRPLSPNAATHHVAQQVDAPDSLLAHYRRLMRLRRTRASLREGVVGAIVQQGKVLAFDRIHGEERTRVLINAGASAVAPGSLRPAAATVIAGDALARLPAHGLCVLDLAESSTPARACSR
jgi:alpha-amylase